MKPAVITLILVSAIVASFTYGGTVEGEFSAKEKALPPSESIHVVEEDDNNLHFFINAILGICALSIAVNAGLTITANFRSNREQDSHLKKMKLNSEIMISGFQERLDKLLVETEEEMKAYIMNFGRAHNIRRELYSKDGYDPDLIYDDIRQLCLKPDERFSHIYQIIIDKAKEEDLKKPAKVALDILKKTE